MTQMFPEHRERIASSFSKHLLGDRQVQRYFEDTGPKTCFDFSVGRKGTLLKAEGRGTELFDLGAKANWRLRKTTQRTVQFYRHTGILPGQVASPKSAERRAQMTKVAVDAMRQASIPGAKERALVLTAVSENGIALARDAIRSIPEFGPSHPLAHNLAFPAGAIWTGFAVREIKGGYSDYKHAQEIGDKEGSNRALGRISTGTFGFFGSGFFLAGKATASAGAAVMAANTLSLVGDLCFGVGSIIGMGLSTLGIYRCHKFKGRLNEYWQNRKLTKEQQVRGTLEFLRDLLVITPQEKKELLQKIKEEHPNLPESEKAALVKQKMEELTEIKVKYLKRRTSNKCLGLILDKVEPLLAKLKDPALKTEVIQETEELVRAVKKDINWKIGLYVVGLIASLISFAAVIMANIASMGTLPYIISGVASIIFLCLTAYNFGLQLFKKEPEVQGLPMEPLGAHN